MKKIFTFIFALAASAGCLYAQETETGTSATAQSWSGQYTGQQPKGNGGVRFAIEGGYSLRLGSFEGMVSSQDAFRLRSGFIVGMNLGGIFRNGRDALGVAVDYRNHTFNNSGFVNGNKYIVTTIFAGPVYTGVIGRGSFRRSHGFCEAALGYTYFGEKLGNERSRFDCFGTKLGIGYAAIDQKSFAFTLKLSLLAATIPHDDPDTMEKERGTIASINLTLGFAFGN
ncbi:hypothetical protein LJC45_01400 [Alistipes sp. OttesenSCG-928-B03]|nr:hypothetical protein [Alistipes sp. OttesenSCG-928-B03]